jgi:hypothetical protein
MMMQQNFPSFSKEEEEEEDVEKEFFFDNDDLEITQSNCIW